jgi:F-type H+-transporting ATPase subunit epsilon
MAKSIKFQLVAPDRPAVVEDVQMVILPGGAGEFGVQPQHMPLLSTLKPGVLRVVKGQQRDLYFVSKGFVEVNPHSIIVLAEAYEKSDEIDVESAQKAIKKGGELLTNQETIDDEAARQSILNARARLQVVEEAKSIKK